MTSTKRLLLLCAFVVCCNLTLVFLFASKASVANKYSLIINKDRHVLAYLPDDFLSIGIDTKEVEKYKTIDFTNERLRQLAAELAPARLRLGGTMSERLIFSTTGLFETTCDQCNTLEFDKTCTYVKQMCNHNLPFFIMPSSKFEEINEFCKHAKLKLLFSLNVLLRNGSEWNELNAKELILFAMSKKYRIDWQLGNEPNSFNHTFNITVTPEELGNDFRKLQSLLKQYGYDESLIVGPDTTRPQPKRPYCLDYMVEFLGNASEVINVRSWHQYYLDSRTATLDDFWNVATFNLLEDQIITMQQHTLEYSNIPMWLSETSSSYGGGAAGLSDSYAATPLWLDKLGLAAKYNITTVIRQSFIGGHYSLIDKNFNPLPDWWVSVLYKRLVGNKVLDIQYKSSDQQRFYMHCTKMGYVNDTTAITVYGVNLYSDTVHLNLVGTALLSDNLLIDEYVIRAPSNDRKTTKVLLNGWPLIYNSKIDLQPKILKYGNKITMPPFSVGFWIIKNTAITICP